MAGVGEAAAVVGLIDTAAQLSKAVVDIASRYKNARRQIETFGREVGILGDILGQLYRLLRERPPERGCWGLLRNCHDTRPMQRSLLGTRYLQRGALQQARVGAKPHISRKDQMGVRSSRARVPTGEAGEHEDQHATHDDHAMLA